MKRFIAAGFFLFLIHSSARPLSAAGHSSFSGRVVIQSANAPSLDVSGSTQSKTGGLNVGSSFLVGQSTPAAAKLQVFSVAGSTGQPLFRVSTGTTNQFEVNAASIVVGVPIQFSTGTATGGGTTLLGTNSPASTVNSPYTWVQVRAPDGSICWIPMWK